MPRIPYLGALVLLLFIAGTSLGAPQPSAPTDTSQQVSPDRAPWGTFPPFHTEGYLRTTSYFQLFKDKAGEIQAELRRLHAEATTASSGDKARQQTLFLQKLASRYPGATFDGRVGSVPIQENFDARFTGDLTVESIRESGRITLDYLVNLGRIQLSDKTSSITILLDQKNPLRSTFINVSIPFIKEEAEKIVTDPGRRRIAADTAESAVLNDAYQLMSLIEAERMDIYAADMMRDADARQKSLKIAAKGYGERHPQDYQPETPEQRKKRLVDTRPNKPADQRFYERFARLSLFILGAAAVLAVGFTGRRTLKKWSAAKNRKQLKRQNRYRSLSPMVKRALRRQGRALWGMNLPWGRFYYVYERGDRWLLCDGREDPEKKIFEAHTKIVVFYRKTYFKVKITRLNGSRANIWLHCNDLTEWDLRKRLQEICREVTNPSGRDDGEDADEAAEDAELPEEAPQPSDGTTSAPSAQEATPGPAEEELPEVAPLAGTHPAERGEHRPEEPSATLIEVPVTAPDWSRTPDAGPVAPQPATVLDAAESEGYATEDGQNRKRPPRWSRFLGRKRPKRKPRRIRFIGRKGIKPLPKKRRSRSRGRIRFYLRPLTEAVKPEC